MRVDQFESRRTNTPRRPRRVPVSREVAQHGFAHAFGNVAAGALDAFDAETARRLEELEQR